jgi:transporter family-2 protein
MTIAAGALLPAQFATNAALAGQLHSVTLTGATSYLVGATFLLLVAAAQRQSADWGAARRGPRWSWLGGVAGSAYIVGSVLLTRALGAAIATTIVIAAQLVTAVLLDHFGALGLVRRRLNGARLGALALALAALGLRLAGAH